MNYLKYIFFGCLTAIFLCGASSKKQTDTRFVNDDGHYIFDTITTTRHQAITLYSMGQNGLLCKDTIVQITDSVNVKPEDIIGIHKNNSTVVYTTDRGVFTAIVGKDFKNTLKDNKKIRELKNDTEFNNEIQKAINTLDARANALNAKYLEDIESKQNAAKQHQAEINEYRTKRRHSWRKWKMKTNYQCDVCDETHTGDSVYLVKATANYWFYKTKSPGQTDWSPIIHSLKPPKTTENNAMFLEAFADSINAITATKRELPTLTIDALRKKNELYRNDAFRKSVPWGFISNWGWDVKNDNVIFEVTFLNTSDSTIKYIDFYATVTNDDKKVLASCLFKTSNPVLPHEYGYWIWDSSKYKVDNSASKMSFTKVVIVYTDDSKKVLTGKELKVFRK